LFFGVLGRESDTEASLTRRNGGRSDGLQEVAGGLQCCGGSEGSSIVSEEERDDRSIRAGGFKRKTESGSEARRPTGEGEAEVVTFRGRDDTQGCSGRGCDGRGRRCCIDEGARFVGEDGAEAGVARDEGAGSAESLAEGSDEDVWLDARLRAEAATRRAEGAEGMGLVDHEGGVVLDSEVGQGG
jgi:hypothetical protein